MPVAAAKSGVNTPVGIKGIWEVRAGLLPDQPEPNLTKRWVYTSEDYKADRQFIARESPDTPLDIRKRTKFMELREEAMNYFARMNEPRLLNWAEIEWTWYDPAKSSPA